MCKNIKFYLDLNPIRVRLFKKLAGQTIIYGMGTIVPRVLNYAVLTFYYTRIFEVQEYGIIAELYAYITFLLIILTYGMETGFFRFTTVGNDNNRVYSIIMHSIITTSILFLIIVKIFVSDIAHFMKYEGKEIYIILLSGIVSIDAFLAVPFAKLRQEEKAKKFALIKIANVIINIVIVLFFYWIVPKIGKTIGIYRLYGLKVDVGYVLLANFLTSATLIVLLWDDIKIIKVGLFNWKLYKRIFIYSSPLLIAGLAGTINETIDRILIKQIITDLDQAEYMLGIYSANYKIAILLLIFIQMFRYAIEPFFFNYSKEKDAKKVYAQIMSVFIASVLLIGVGILLYIDILKYFISPKFHEGLNIVPIVIASYIFYGILFNLSVWYKLTNRTLYGAMILIIGSILTIIINIKFLPTHGYIACAYAHLISYSMMVLISLLLGRKYYRINYNIKRILVYFAIAIIIISINYKLNFGIVIDYMLKSLLIIVFGFAILKIEKIINIRKYLNKEFK